jgi:hypothetical protein
VEHQDAIEQTFSAHAATFCTSQQLVEDSSTRLLRIRITQLANGGSYEAARGVPELHCDIRPRNGTRADNPDPAPHLTAIFARTTFTNHLRSHFKCVNT